jgi:hypothetical protein
MEWMRDILRRQGIPNEAIGWEEPGWVTLGGKRYYQPPLETGGRSYAYPGSIPDVTAYMPQLNTAPRYDYGPDVLAALQKFQGLLSAAPVTPQQVVASPEYQAQKGYLDLQRGEAMAALRRDLASRTMLRSTPAIGAFGQVQSEADIRAGQLIPSMMGEARSQQQQQLTNQLQGLQAFVERQRYEEDTATAKAKLLRDIVETNRQFGLSEAGVTGTYMGQPTFAAGQAVAAGKERAATAAEAQKRWGAEFAQTQYYQGQTLAQAGQPKAPAVRTPKEQYEDTIYNKLAQGMPLTEDEQRFLGITAANVRSIAMGMAQKDFAWEGEENEAVLETIIQKYMRLLQGQAAPATTSETVDEWTKGGYTK